MGNAATEENLDTYRQGSEVDRKAEQ